MRLFFFFISLVFSGLILMTCNNTHERKNPIAPSTSSSLLVTWEKQLVNDWITPAWDGQLRETWYISPDQQLSQKASYTVNGEVQYEAQSRMIHIGEELVLITVIVDADPKVFRATSVTDSMMVFENSTYRNPDKVVYRLTKNGYFSRTISGHEPDGSASSYTFEFVPEAR